MKHPIFKHIILLLAFVGYMPVVYSQTWITIDDMEYNNQYWDYNLVC